MNIPSPHLINFKLTLRKFLVNLGILLIILNLTVKSSAQSDRVRLDNLIKETNERYIYLIAHAVYLSPYELRHEHLYLLVKNMKYVDSINIIIEQNDKKELSSIVVKNNKTLIYKFQNTRDPYTYMYHKDGRIHKKLRGRSLNALYLYEDDYLVQHGMGGELKRAKRIDNKVEWYNVKRNRLEYVTEFGEYNRIKTFKTMGHHFGPAVEYEMEDYTFKNDQLVQFLSWTKYKGSPQVRDTLTTTFRYDSLGLINGFGHANSRITNKKIRAIDSKITKSDQNHITISISSNGVLEYSMTYDQYGNWIEEVRPFRTINRTIHYRKKKRRR